MNIEQSRGRDGVESPRLVLDTGSPLIDRPVGFRVAGLRPGRAVAISAASTDALGVRFASRATFVADSSGGVDPRLACATGGAYEGIDPHGLWWTMTSAGGEPFAVGLDPVPTTVVVEIDGEPAASADFERVRLRADVVAAPVRDQGLVATVFRPGLLPAPGLLLLGGSGGGLHWSEPLAALLASHGFVTMALAYFGLPGLPDYPVSIPLEHVGAAISWLAAREEVAGDRIGVLGGSRGAELALLAAAENPQAGAVVGFSASGVAWGGFHPDDQDPGPAWTRAGAGVPYGRPDPAIVEEVLAGDPVVLADLFLSAFGDRRRMREAEIPVERIQGPLLLISGEDDRMWPAARLSEIAIGRLATNGHPYPSRHLRYPGAGHSAGQPPGLPAEDAVAVHPLDGESYAMGGSKAANATSSADAWPRVLDFLRTHLGGPG